MAVKAEPNYHECIRTYLHNDSASLSNAECFFFKVVGSRAL